MKRPLKHNTRKKRKLTRNNYITLAFCILVCGGFLCTLFSQGQTQARIRKELARVNEEIAVKKEQYELLEEKQERNSGDDFYEEKARDEGYVREDETLFVVGN